MLIIKHVPKGKKTLVFPMLNLKSKGLFLNIEKKDVNS